MNSRKASPASEFKFPPLPAWSKDWRVWVGGIAAVSFFMALGLLGLLVGLMAAPLRRFWTCSSVRRVGASWMVRFTSAICVESRVRSGMCEMKVEQA